MSELLAGLLGVLIGAFLGHRFSLGRDKRREYNKAISPFLEYLYQIEGQAEKGHIWSEINEPDLLKLKIVLPKRKVKKLDKLISDYQESLLKVYPTNKEKPWEGTSAVKSELCNTIQIIQSMKKVIELR